MEESIAACSFQAADNCNDPNKKVIPIKMNDRRQTRITAYIIATS